MNITCNTTQLAAELRLLTKVAPAKSTLPILSHVLLRAEDQLYLSATDLEIAYSTSCPATIHEIGESALPAHTLLSMLEQLPDGDVTIHKDRITSSGFTSRIAALPAADFPPLPASEGDMMIISGLPRLIERVTYAVRDKTQKYILEGALLSLVGNVMAMVAVDGKRLSIATASRSGPDVEVVLPHKTMDVLQGVTGEVQFSRSERHLFFKYGRRLLVSRTLDGKFPNYQRIIPRGNDQVASANRVQLSAALRRVGLVAETLYLSFEEGRLSLTSRSAEIGDAEEDVQIQYSGPAVRLCVNWKYVLDFLDHAVEPLVSMAIKDSKSPLMLSDGVDYVNVVMCQQV